MGGRLTRAEKLTLSRLEAPRILPQSREISNLIKLGFVAPLAADSRYHVATAAGRDKMKTIRKPKFNGVKK